MTAVLVVAMSVAVFTSIKPSFRITDRPTPVWLAPIIFVTCTVTVIIANFTGAISLR
jgi:hypothetical protein